MLHTSARNEAIRLRALEQYQLTGALADPGLEEITRLAAEICAAPVAGISIVDADTIHILARVGPGPNSVPRGNTPCDICIQSDALYEIADARYHPEFRPDGILVGGRSFRFYAGVPLTTPQGAPLGCLFVQAQQPYSLTLKQKAALTTLARQVVTRFELNARARTTDTDDRARHRVESALIVERNFVSAILDTVGALVAVFDTAGRIVRFNRTCEEVSGYEFSELVGRFFWDDLIPEQDIGTAVEAFERLRDGEFPASFENYWKHRNGELRCIAWSATALVDDQGAPNFIIATGIDVTEQRAAEATLRDSEARFRQLAHQSNSILESVGDGIYGIDLRGNVTVINPAACQMLGYKPAEVLGRNFHHLVHHSHPDGTPYPEEECPTSRTTRTGETIRVADEVFWRKDGSSFPVEYVARPQIIAESDSSSSLRRERAIGVVVAFRDTTERRALDRLKDEFISTVSHELRTPLTSLRAALGLVTGGALDKRPEKKSEMLAIAVGNTDRLIKLVNDILDIERITSGNADLHSTMCSAGALFERAVKLQQAAADKCNLRFVIEPNAVEVYADPDRILQALTNLISNAIKFSPLGATISLTARYLDEHEARFDVHDEGRGIPPEKLESIFERFHQVDASDTRALGGTGLGLAICRSILTQHGGRIWANSSPGRGATFHFTLPTRPASHLR
jgi:two-component system sensor histidine kinase VicK